MKKDILSVRSEYLTKHFVDNDEQDPFEEDSSQVNENFTLTPKQQEAFELYKKKCHEGKDKFLLFGITGSGKTLLYLNMIEEELKKGKQCLFLVPEIALTPQMTRSIKNFFSNEEVAVIHSRLSLSKKDIAWEKIRNGKIKIVLGARSAVFMPFKDLGLMVIDEEHENSYKSFSSPRYDTIKAAEFISSVTGAKIVLGSATPSIESFYKAKTGEYELLTLNERINKKPTPPVNMVDMRSELHEGNKSLFSRLLYDEIKKRLEKKEQIILFLNRRGYSTYVFCRQCGYIEKCPECDVSLTYHKGKNYLTCHYCGYKKEVPSRCPNCGSDKIKFMGTGTQKVEEKVKEAFPDARTVRLDSDVTKKVGEYERVLEAFSHGEADILIGTQMVVKGLDFSNVTLVGILLADASLTFPDIKAAERTFQLCTQASGRAGRGEIDGLVVMQAYQAENETLVYSANQDYEGFYAFEIEHRQNLNYPPFSEILGIFCANEDEELCIREMYTVYDIIKEKTEKYKDVILYEPSPAFIHKLKGKYMMHILVKYPKNHEIKKEIREDYNRIKNKVSSNMFAETDPVTLL